MMKKYLSLFLFLTLFGIVSCDKKDKEVTTENQLISEESKPLETENKDNSFLNQKLVVFFLKK